MYLYATFLSSYRERRLNAADILTALNAERGGGWMTAVDVAFFVVLGLTILARCLDFRAGNPQTAMGTPATSAHLRRYVSLAVLVGLAVWGIANLIGNH